MIVVDEGSSGGLDPSHHCLLPLTAKVGALLYCEKCRAAFIYIPTAHYWGWVRVGFFHFGSRRRLRARGLVPRLTGPVSVRTDTKTMPPPPRV